MPERLVKARKPNCSKPDDPCDNPVHPHQGPVSARSYALPLREGAAAFIAVATGGSYYRAADLDLASATASSCPRSGAVRR